MEEKKSIFRTLLSKLIEPTRIVSILTTVFCLGAAVGGGALFAKIGLGNTSLMNVFTNPQIHVFGLAVNSRIVLIVLEMIGWASFVYSLREICWKLLDSDYKKFIPLAVIMFVCICIFTSSRMLKNSLVVPVMGSQAAQIAKVIVFPAAIIYSIYLSFINGKLKIKNWAYFVVLPIIIYFLVFVGFRLDQAAAHPWLFPSAEFMRSYSELWIAKWIVPPILANYPSFIFYILCEVCSVGCITLPWQIINSQIDRTSSKRFITCILIIAQFATILAGLVFESGFDFISGYFEAKAIGSILMSESMRAALKKPDTVLLGLLTILICSICLFVANYVLFQWCGGSEIEEKSSAKKVKMGFKIAVKNAWVKPLYLFMVLGTICYGITTPLFEQAWQASLQVMCNQVSDYFGRGGAILSSRDVYDSVYAGYVVKQGRISLIFVVCLTTVLARTLSWFSFASMLPAVTLVSGVFMFGTIIVFGATGNAFGYDTIPLVAAFGSIFVAMQKSVKIGGTDYTRAVALNSIEFSDKTMIQAIDSALGRIGKLGTTFITISITFVSTALGIRSIGKSSALITRTAAWIFSIVVLISVGLWIIALRKTSDTLQLDKKE